MKYNICLLVMDQATGEKIFDISKTDVPGASKDFQLAGDLYAQMTSDLSEAERAALQNIPFPGA